MKVFLLIITLSSFSLFACDQKVLAVAKDLEALNFTKVADELIIKDHQFLGKLKIFTEYLPKYQIVIENNNQKTYSYYQRNFQG